MRAKTKKKNTICGGGGLKVKRVWKQLKMAS